MIRYSCITLLIIILAFLQYRLWLQHNGVQATLALKKDINIQQRANLQMQQRNQALMAEVENLKHGKAAIEERARDELGMIKKDEQFYQIAKPVS